MELTDWLTLLLASGGASLLYLLLYLAVGAPQDGRALVGFIQRRLR